MVVMGEMGVIVPIVLIGEIGVMGGIGGVPTAEPPRGKCDDRCRLCAREDVRLFLASAIVNAIVHVLDVHLLLTSPARRTYAVSRRR
jgi:hypothetical protein